MPDQYEISPEVRALYESRGPFVSLYLDTTAAKEQGPEELALRWRGLRDKAAGAEATGAALDALDNIVDGSHRNGDGLIAFAAGDKIAHRRFLRRRPVDDGVHVGPLPHLIPLFEWAQDNPRYAVVLSDRTGAEIHVIGGRGEENQLVDVEGDHDELRKVQPGGWSQRRFQARAEDSWEHNAKQVAEKLSEVVRSERLEFVLIAGDVRAVQFLHEHLPKELGSTAYELESEPNSINEIRDDIERTAASYSASTLEELLQRYQEERGQADLATEGVERTLEALRMSQVDTLLVGRDVPQMKAWFSPASLDQAATDAQTLKDLGLDDVQEGDLVDVLVRSALGTGARVRVLPNLRQDQLPAEGVGALLRFRT